MHLMSSKQIEAEISPLSCSGKLQKTLPGRGPGRSRLDLQDLMQRKAHACARAHLRTSPDSHEQLHHVYHNKLSFIRNTEVCQGQGLLGLPGGGELLAGGVGRVGSPLTVGVVLGPRVVLGGDGMVQTLHAAPGAVLIRTLPQVRPRVKAAGQVGG